MKAAVASAAMGILVWLALRGEMWRAPGNAPLKAAWLFGGIAASAVFYVIISRTMRCEELQFITERFLKRRRSED
jgi:hypothetical protein